MKGKLGAERLAAYYADPANAEQRRRRAAELLRDPETKRRRRAAIRGCDVPPELEAEWAALKEKRLSNQEAAKALGLKFTVRKKRTKRAGPGRPRKGD